MLQADNNGRKGFSLAEAMMATVVLGIAAAGVLLPFSSGVSIRNEGTHRTTGAVLAADLVDRIVWNYLSGNISFNQIITNFNGYTELEGQVRDAQGNFFTVTDPSYAKYSRNAACVYWPLGTPPASAKFILATVQVSYNGKQVAVINRLISK